jgi:ABC-type microcin C transport system permease subunit YejE
MEPLEGGDPRVRDMLARMTLRTRLLVMGLALTIVPLLVITGLSWS